MPPLPRLLLYPQNKLLSYWDTIEDRLYKIRNCMNIEGGASTVAVRAIDQCAVAR
jgi:hypothetical protein